MRSSGALVGLFESNFAQEKFKSKVCSVYVGRIWKVGNEIKLYIVIKSTAGSQITNKWYSVIVRRKGRFVKFWQEKTETGLEGRVSVGIGRLSPILSSGYQFPRILHPIPLK